jgi:hypothetical protein
MVVVVVVVVVGGGAPIGPHGAARISVGRQANRHGYAVPRETGAVVRRGVGGGIVGNEKARRLPEDLGRTRRRKEADEDPPNSCHGGYVAACLCSRLG